MNVTFQLSHSSPCSCPAAAGSACFPVARNCRLGQVGTAPCQQFAPVMPHQAFGWSQRRELRQFRSYDASASSLPSVLPTSQKRSCQAAAYCTRSSSSFTAVASRDRRSGYVPGLQRCRAMGSTAADTGLSGAGPPSPSHNWAQDAAASATPVPLQSSQIQPLHGGPDQDPVSLRANNGHPPSTVTAATGAQLNRGDSGATSITAGTADASYGAAAEPALTDVDPGATSVDGLDDTRKFVFADEWGFTRVGGNLPEGTTPATFSDMFPDHFFAFDPRRAAVAIAVPLAAMAVGYGWLWYMHSICPAWQQLACAALIGTAYTGLFKVAHECACFRFLPESPRLQDAVGLVLMLPSLYPFTSWRLQYMHHLAHVNMLWEDTFGWHPYTKLQLATEVLLGGRWRLALRRLALTTPLKLFASIGHWLRSFDGLDLKRFHQETYWAVLAGWAGPILFVGFGVPAILKAFGVSGFLSGYLLPWLVFHFWMSTLSMLQHTAPHIPFRAEDEGYDYGRATICGTVTVRLPRPLELLLNDANYTLPQLVAPGLPGFHAREAYAYMRERLLPYLTEATLSIKLLTNHITKWQVYDEERETYLPMDELQQALESDMATILAEVEKEEMEKAEAVAASTAESVTAAGATEGNRGPAGTGETPAFA
ncbi:hypothetical protein Vretimale_973 [Volvox reticuliferus]|uniref:Fatty acid desaturase domain-containing protein n=1 Tax=Volvox reticuliferus TaxID=1737510 RepID=A0A8J4G337_9CHLO|nr:hypothetical protein Vretifemale_10520 [Volvox reticuliferus]GIL94887.1 hypothetical protein Vretimale_973 [Volvox reticuliferus]